MTKKEHSLYMKKYRIKYSKEIAEYNKKYQKEYRKKHRLEHNKSSRKYYSENREYYRKWHKLYDKKYHKKNKKKLTVQHNKYMHNRFKKDIDFRVLCNLRSRIGMALKRNSKSEHTIDLIGCSIKFLKKYLGKQFTKGMSWNNYGKWHIDHIKPCNSFDLSNPEQQRKCFRYGNLQPLWKKDNLIKRKK